MALINHLQCFECPLVSLYENDGQIMIFVRVFMPNESDDMETYIATHITANEAISYIDGNIELQELLKQNKIEYYIYDTTVKQLSLMNNNTEDIYNEFSKSDYKGKIQDIYNVDTISTKEYLKSKLNLEYGTI